MRAAKDKATAEAQAAKDKATAEAQAAKDKAAAEARASKDKAANILGLDDQIHKVLCHMFG